MSQTKTTSDASRLLGSRLKVIPDRRDVLAIELEDIYFITGLSRRGEVVNLHSHGPRGGLTIDDYIAMYFYLDTEKVGSQIPTNSIQVLGLKAILLMLGGIESLDSLH